MVVEDDQVVLGGVKGRQEMEKEEEEGEQAGYKGDEERCSHHRSSRLRHPHRLSGHGQRA